MKIYYYLCLALVLMTILFSPIAFSSSEKLSDKKLSDKLGLSYFIFWDGPNLDRGRDVTTNELGETNNPINTYNLISFKYKLSEKYSLDAQTGTQWFQTRVPRFYFDRVRVGISGKLWKANEWKLDGAINSDLPYTGYTAEQRRLIFSPGMFANLSYTPSSSRFSFWALLQPRVWFYSDREAVEPEWIAANRRPGQKFESIISLTPTVNYSINDKFGLRMGVGLDYRKLVENNWATWIRWATPVTTGFTYTYNSSFSTYTYVQTFPFEGGGVQRETSSLGMWITGTIF
ncbi:MAG: hypothetical protein ACOVP4_08540 [Bacteriovoracaceae bacterium]